MPMTFPPALFIKQAGEWRKFLQIFRKIHARIGVKNANFRPHALRTHSKFMPHFTPIF